MNLNAAPTRWHQSRKRKSSWAAICAAAVLVLLGVATSSQAAAIIADLQITSSDSTTTAVPGTTATYTIIVTNDGPDAVNGAPVATVFNPAASISAVSYSATPTGVATGFTGNGNGNINDSVNMAAGSSITYTLIASIKTDASGTLVLTATVTAPSGVTDPQSGNNIATDTDTLSAQADLGIKNFDNMDSAVPGTTVVYTIQVNNAGPSDVFGAHIDDMLPPDIDSATFTADQTGGATGFTATGSGNINDSADMPVGSTITYLLTAHIRSSATGSVTTTATVTAPAGVTEVVPGSSNTFSDTDTLTPQADLQITNTDGKPLAAPGTTATYTIVASNNGPSDVVGATVANMFNPPASVSAVSYTATQTGGATSSASGNGNINDIVNMPAGSTITYTLTALVDPAATGTISNTATVTAPAGVTETDSNNNSSTDSDFTVINTDLLIFVDDSQTSAVPGTAVTYMIVASNDGPMDATGASVVDILPATFTGATFTATQMGGASGFTASGSGNINDTVDLPVNSTITYMLIASVAPSASGTLSNTVTITPSSDDTDINQANNSSTDNDTLIPSADLVVSLSAPSAVLAGNNLVYTITLKNNGPSDSQNVALNDMLPAGLSLVSEDQTTGSMFLPNNNGNQLQSTIATLPANDIATFIVTAGVAANTPDGTVYANTASANSQSDDPFLPNNVDSATTTVGNIADLAVTMSAPATVLAGNDLIYTITLANNGPSVAQNVVLNDPLPTVPAGLSFVSQSQTAGPSFQLSITGNPLNDTIASLAVSASATFSVVYNVAANTPGGTVYANTASASSSVIDADSSNNSYSATTTVTHVTVVQATASGSPLSGTVPLTVSFTGGPDGAAYAWDFKDGTPSTLQNPSHTFIASGTYSVVLTASAGGASGMATLTVVVNAAGGSFPGDTDSDGDGFYDEIESALTTNPRDPAATPFGLPKPASIANLPLKSLKINLNFAKPASNDSILASGTLTLPASFRVADGLKVIVDVGGVVRGFSLDSKGASPKGNEQFKLKLSRAKSGASTVSAKFTVTLKKGTYAAALKDDGLENNTVTKNVNVPMTLIFNGSILQKVVPQAYKAKAENTGAAKSGVIP